MADRRGTGLETLVVGLDGACAGVLDPLFEAGAIPHLRSVFENGITGGLESQVPPWTPSAWPSLYTGVNPGKHGVFGFLAFDGYDWTVVNRTYVREHALWELLDREGKSSVVVNVPVTHPPVPIDGAVVPGYVAPDPPTCHPRGLLEDIEAELGEYRVYAPPDVSPEDEAARLAWYRKLVRMRGAAFRYLCERFDPAFGFLQFQQPDTVCHEFPGDAEKLRLVYEDVDEQIGAVLDQCDPDTVFVVSDHGIGEYTGYEFRVNDYLRDHGFVEATRGGSGMPSWSAIARNRFHRERDADGGDGPPATTSLQRVAGLAARCGLTSQRVGAALGAVGLREFVLRHVSPDVVRAGKEHVDFPTSIAYVRSRVECGVRLNLAGREPAGVVPESDYDRTRDRVISVLRRARTPDGARVFSTVAPREAYYDGPHVEAAPDVITVPAGFDHYLSAQLHGTAFADPGDLWNHKLGGVFAAAGAGIDAGTPVADAHIFDVAPTVLATLGVPVSDRMDGRVLPFAPDADAKPYPACTPSIEEASPGVAVETRLADLGYLER